MTPGKTGLLTRIYIWSIVLEPLLFFLLADRSVMGIGGNISRLLQFVVILGLVVKMIDPDATLKLPNPFNPLYRKYTYYFLLVVLAGVIGLMNGAFQSDLSAGNQSEMSGLAKFLNGPSLRPLFEYFITLYYFVYFCILPVYLIKTAGGVNYFFKVFFLMFVLCLLIGYTDLISVLMHHELVPRHMLEGKMVGLRFHGLAGEPRDAFVYMLLALAVLNLRNFWVNGSTLSMKWIIVILLTAVLTQSASGLLGLGIGGVLIIVFTGERFSFKSLVQKTLLVALVLLVIYVSFISSPRLIRYYETVPQVMAAVQEGGTIPPVFVGQMTNIYPLWDFKENIANLKILPVIFGQGLGSASALNSHLYGENDVMNPNSEIVRVIFESGIVGLIMLILAFVYPVRRLTEKIPVKTRKRFLLIMLVLVGGFMGHRTSAVYIYLGMFIAVMNMINQREEKSVNLMEDTNPAG